MASVQPSGPPTSSESNASIATFFADDGDATGASGKIGGFALPHGLLAGSPPSNRTSGLTGSTMAPPTSRLPDTPFIYSIIPQQPAMCVVPGAPMSLPAPDGRTSLLQPSPTVPIVRTTSPVNFAGTGLLDFGPLEAAAALSIPGANRPAINGQPSRPALPRPMLQQVPPAIPPAMAYTTKIFDEQGHDNRLALWVGNLPAETTEEELADFFAECDVTSVRVLSNSRCGFVNMASEEQVDYAARAYHEKLFKGSPICCRARKTFKFPVSRRSQLQQQLQQQAPIQPQPQPTVIYVPIPVDPLDGDEGIFRDPRQQQRWLESRGLIRPDMQNRYFVMRGLTLLDLELSVRNGVWATQKRNTLTLNQAFHMCENVYLIFSVLGSNEWFGLARMEAPIPVIRVQSIATRLDGTADPFAGEFFRVQWICSAAHLPFHETDHIINPFNLGSVVKRSVDGTEVHPGWAETLIAAIHAASTKNEVARIATQSRNPSWQRPVSPTDDWFQSTSTPRSARPPSESSFGAIGAEVKHKSSPQIELQPGPKTMHDMLPPLPKSTSGEVTRTVSFPFLTIATDGTIEDPSSIAESSGSTAAGSSGIDHLTHGLWDLGLGARSPSPSARPGSPFSPFAFTY